MSIQFVKKEGPPEPDDQLLTAKEAAAFLGIPAWKLEQMRRTRRRAQKANQPELEWGPHFKMAGHLATYTVRSLKSWRAHSAVIGSSVSTQKAAVILGVHRNTMDQWRKTWETAEKAGNPDLRKGPPFFRLGLRRYLYERKHLAEYLAKHGKPKSEDDNSAPD